MKIIRSASIQYVAEPLMTKEPKNLLDICANLKKVVFRPESISQGCESGYPCVGYSKHKFACIQTTAVHNNTGSELVKITLK